MKEKIVEHLNEVGSFWAMEVLARANALEKEGRNIIHLEVGEPDFPTPKLIADAAISSIQKSFTRYTNTQGTDEFRNAVVQKYKSKYGVDFSPSQIITSAGSSILLYMAIRLLVPPGKEIIMTDPAYPCYNNLSALAGVTPVKVKLRLEDKFELDVDAVKKAITKNTRAILINSPMNPTGTTIPSEKLKELAALGVPIISDEIYSDLVYEGKAETILNYTDNCIVLNGLSKYYAMTGWRLGFMILPPEWVDAAARVHQNIMLSAGHFVQEAGTVALLHAEDDCEKMRKEFDERRKFLLKRLIESGMDPQYNPVGAFYVLFRYPQKERDSLSVSLDILERKGVALTPGIDFGSGGEGFLRFSYANSLDNIDKAVNRLSEYFHK